MNVITSKISCNGCSGCDYNFCRRGKQMTTYVYTTDNCPRCIELKKEYDKCGVVYVERSADRIKSPQDETDREALVQASMQNMELPVVVTTEKES